MRSIRASLVFGTVIATVTIVALAGTAVYRGEQSALVRQVDRSLAAEARLLGSAVKSTPDGIDLEFSELDMRDFAGHPARAYLQLWRNDGSDIYTSPGLGGKSLEVVRDTSGQPSFQWVNVNDNAHVRAVTIPFRATAEQEEDGGVAAEPVEPFGGYVVLARDASDVARALARLRLLLGAVGVLSGLLVVASLAVVIRRGLRPLDDLAGRIAALRDDDLSQRVTLSSAPREIAPVVQHLNELLERLDAAFERERTFGADIAHELRTPLAGLRSTIEVTLAHPRGTEDYTQALDESLDMVTRLQDLVETILYLVSLDAGRVETEPQAVDLSELVETSWRPLRRQVRGRGVSVEWNLEPAIRVSTDPMLLEVAIRNILENAVAYVDDSGRIAVEGSREGGRGVVRVVNSGSDVAQEQVGELTRRFTRADSSRTMSGGHFGLGLALVARIAAVLGCEVDLRSSAGGDFEVVLSVPGADAEGKA